MSNLVVVCHIVPMRQLWSGCGDNMPTRDPPSPCTMGKGAGWHISGCGASVGVEGGTSDQWVWGCNFGPCLVDGWKGGGWYLGGGGVFIARETTGAPKRLRAFFKGSQVKLPSPSSCALCVVMEVQQSNLHSLRNQDCTPFIETA